MPRPKSTRPPSVVAPLLISQLNCESICGIDARRFLELLPRLSVTVAKIGKLRLVDAERFRAQVLAAADDPALALRDDSHLQPESVEEVLAAIGRRLKP